jgi:hypothetical protein
LTLLVVAPFFGEVLSTATAPLDILLPWNLALVVGMYGCGALPCREVAHRYGLGWPGLLLLGAAYGVYEEGLVDRFWYDPQLLGRRRCRRLQRCRGHQCTHRHPI